MGIKTTAQQATLTLHRQREALMKMRIMQTNALRGLLYEFGATFAKGKNALLKDIEKTLDALADILPQMVAIACASKCCVSRPSRWTCRPSKSGCNCSWRRTGKCSALLKYRGWDC